MKEKSMQLTVRISPEFADIVRSQKNKSAYINACLSIVNHSISKSTENEENDPGAVLCPYCGNKIYITLNKKKQ